MSSSGPPTSAEPELCAADCGFFGSSVTMGFCSVCFKLFVLSQSASQTPATTTTAITINTTTATSTSTSDETNQEVSAPATATAASEVIPANRCSICRRKVGLLGFSCRCGATFCGTHRYPEMHVCNFDFKAVGRKEIAESNPVVKPDKLDRF